MDAVLPTSQDVALVGAVDRRRIDRRRGVSATLLARFLAGAPQLDDVLLLIVSMLAWPIGARGALVVRAHTTASAPLAACMDECEGWSNPVDRAQWLEAITGALDQDAGPRFRSCGGHEASGIGPTVCCRLGTPGAPVAWLVIALAEPLPLRTAEPFVAPIADQLGSYLAGRFTDPSPGHAAPDALNGSGLQFSARQRQVLEFLAHDLTMRQIAARIGYSHSTVRMDALAIYRALGVHDRLGALATARNLGLLA